MLSRILWIGLAGIALIAGAILQNRDSLFEGTDHHSGVIERAVDAGVDTVPIVVIDTRQNPVSPDAKRALDDAVRRLLKAETELALVRVRNGDDEARQAAEARRNQARTDVDRLAEQIEHKKDGARVDRDAIRNEVREEVRAAVRDALGG